MKECVVRSGLVDLALRDIQQLCRVGDGEGARSPTKRIGSRFTVFTIPISSPEQGDGPLAGGGLRGGMVKIICSGRDCHAAFRAGDD